MKIKVAVINAFLDGGRGGNPAGVVLDADALSNDQKLAISKKVGLSETAFVSSSDSADFKLNSLLLRNKLPIVVMQQLLPSAIYPN
jgi:PhzF family phenazine biosynthesis protein